MPVSLLEALREIPDHRSTKNLRYPLDEVLLLCVSAVISGASGWHDIAQFGHTKLEWLRRFLAYENGVPDEDTIAWVVRGISSVRFGASFTQWASRLSGSLSGTVVAIDGKASRGSGCSSRGLPVLHQVNAWACDQRLSLAQVATQEKSNEITAIPELLDLLEINGALITIDAMGCQREIANKIVEKKAGYLLALKGNQPMMHEAVTDYFDTALANNFKAVPYDRHETVDCGHGRIEQRSYYLTTDLSTLPEPHKWAGLASIGMAVCITDNKSTGKRSEERRYFLSTVKDAQVFAHAARAHWGIENQLHWVLDVVFRDDASKVRIGEGPKLMNSLRQMGNNLLRGMKNKDSLRSRRYGCTLDDDYRTKALFG